MLVIRYGPIHWSRGVIFLLLIICAVIASIVGRATAKESFVGHWFTSTTTSSAITAPTHARERFPAVSSGSRHPFRRATTTRSTGHASHSSVRIDQMRTMTRGSITRPVRGSRACQSVYPVPANTTVIAFHVTGPSTHFANGDNGLPRFTVV